MQGKGSNKENTYNFKPLTFPHSQKKCPQNLRRGYKPGILSSSSLAVAEATETKKDSIS
jgi:hypothetical protein